jgi:hypothetical protein
MKEDLARFIRYLKLLSKAWVLWVFLALDAIFLVVQLFIPSLNVPHSIYLLVAVVGVVWASFRAYDELMSIIPSENRPVPPEIAISLAQGNEYHYAFAIPPGALDKNSQAILEDMSNALSKADTKSRSKSASKAMSKSTSEVNPKTVQAQDNLWGDPVIPYSQVIIHVRIKNTGLIPVRIISVYGEFDSGTPYRFMVPEPHTENGQRFSFPVRLEPRDSIQVNLSDLIFPSDNVTPAQIAARTRQFVTENVLVQGKISVEVVTPAGSTETFSLAAKLSLLPLLDLYIAHWQRLRKKDLLDLATG